jgi:DNA-binding XRE family transcriptional regulator
MTEQPAPETAQWRPRIAAVHPTAGRAVRVAWDDGSEHVVDLAGFLDRFEVFRPMDAEVPFAGVSVGEWGACLHWTDDMEIAASTLRRLALEQDAARFRAWREGHGLPQAAAGEALGLSRRMMQYYEAGTHPIPKTVKLAMIGYDTLARERAA